jgi:hypothetical protein
MSHTRGNILIAVALLLASGGSVTLSTQASPGRKRRSLRRYRKSTPCSPRLRNATASPVSRTASWLMGGSSIPVRRDLVN